MFNNHTSTSYAKSSSGTMINTMGASVVRNSDNSSVDCSFIPFVSSSLWTKTARYSNSGYSGNIVGSTYAHSSLEGSPVVKYGDNSGRQTGNVLSCSCDVDVDNLHKHDYIYFSTYNNFGDSGGPIGIESNGNNLNLMAITCAKNNLNYTYGCKVTNIYGFLGINPVTN